MKKFIWGITGVSGDRTIFASDENDAITKIIAQIGSQNFWIA
jgi:muconolactone delta-isomerase